MSELEGFANRLNELIKFLKLTTTEFADITNQSASKISKYRRAANWPSIQFLNVIKNIYTHVNIEYLATGHGKLILEEGQEVVEKYEQNHTLRTVKESDNENFKELYHNCREHLRDKDLIIGSLQQQLKQKGG